MARDCLRDVDSDAAKEDGEEGQLGDVFEEGAYEATAFGVVAQDGDADSAGRLEDNYNGEVDLEAINVVVVQVAVEPAYQGVGGQHKDPGGANSIVDADVRHNNDPGHEARVASDEFAEERCHWAARGPGAEGLEDEFGAAIYLFSPRGQFVGDG